jgi:hypothetical protein
VKFPLFSSCVVSDFVRKAIAEKIERDYKELQPKPKNQYCPF